MRSIPNEVVILASIVGFTVGIFGGIRGAIVFIILWTALACNYVFL
jgi:hypothetical protein